RQYAANYHIIETIARGDEPAAVGVSGLRPWRDQYSNFCTKTKIFESFRRIFADMDCPVFVLSYSEDGLLQRAAIEDLLGEFGLESTCVSDFPRFRCYSSPLGPTVKEYMSILERRLKRRPTSRKSHDLHAVGAT
ncbi:MAG: hypothetical protein ACREMY_03750, partial [bacterium]